MSCTAVLADRSPAIASLKAAALQRLDSGQTLVITEAFAQMVICTQGCVSITFDGPGQSLKVHALADAQVGVLALH